MSETESSFVRLSKIDVTARIEKKNGHSYLAWAWAIDQLMRADPDASWEYGDPKTFGAETMMVFCSVTAFGKTRKAHLPVMDHMNKAIQNPNSYQVNTAMQRCLVKGIALHGLGLYVYAGEDIPAQGDDGWDSQFADFISALETADDMEGAKAIYKKGVDACKEHKDIAAAKTLKAKLLELYPDAGKKS